MKEKFAQALSTCGLTLNGPNPFDPQIHNEKFYQQLSQNFSLTSGEGYMDGWWTADELDELIYRFSRNSKHNEIENKAFWAFQWLKNKIFNHQTKSLSKNVADIHYNLDNTLYEHMLGPTMAYTCGYWDKATDLDSAQNAKYQLICDKIDIKPGERILDLGCGFGGLAHYMAKNYDCKVTAVNISTEQIKWARTHTPNSNAQFYEADYRDHQVYNPQDIKFDKVVSVGLCEHIGYKNYQTFVDTIHGQLKDDGLALIHTIGKNDSSEYCDPWIRKYIFPGGMLPSISLMDQAFEGKFVIEDFHNFGADYDRTLMAWYHNFKNNWDKLKHKYDERFYRMWEYYLLSCAGVFRARHMQLWQWTLSPKGKVGGYRSVR